MLPFPNSAEQTHPSPPSRSFEDFPLFPPPPHIETQRALQALYSQNGWLMAEVKAIK
jgi:hypothetical protein